MNWIALFIEPKFCFVKSNMQIINVNAAIIMSYSYCVFILKVPTKYFQKTYNEQKWLDNKMEITENMDLMSKRRAVKNRKSSKYQALN